MMSAALVRAASSVLGTSRAVDVEWRIRALAGGPLERSTRLLHRWTTNDQLQARIQRLASSHEPPDMLSNEN